jgi:hypothetical protein
MASEQLAFAAMSTLPHAAIPALAMVGQPKSPAVREAPNATTLAMRCA